MTTPVVINTLTAAEIDALNRAVEFFEDEFEAYDEATPDELKGYEEQKSALASGIAKVRAAYLVEVAA